MSKTLSRTPPPRQLGNKETLESLLHWKTAFKTFYKRDDCYKLFFKSNTRWDYHLPDYGFSENDDEERSPDEIAEDLTDLLNTLASYLPHSYLTDKLLRNTKCWSDVWNIIHDHYNVQVSSESLLDFESMNQREGETHRQFYERLLQHVKEHLAPADVKVENITNTTADTMSISLMNFVALQWLRKLNPALIDIIKTEYSTELRANTQLADLVPRIAPNISSLLRRYDHGDRVNHTQLQEASAMDALSINKTFSRGKKNATQLTKNQPITFNGDDNKVTQDRWKKDGLFCPGCYYLSQQLGTALHFKHAPGDCPRKAVTVKMFQVEDAQHFEVEKEEGFSTSGKQTKQAMVTNRADTFQIQTKHFNENSPSISSDVKAMATGYLVETNVQTPVPDLC